MLSRGVYTLSFFFYLSLSLSLPPSLSALLVEILRSAFLEENCEGISCVSHVVRRSRHSESGVKKISILLPSRKYLLGLELILWDYRTPVAVRQTRRVCSDKRMRVLESIHRKNRTILDFWLNASPNKLWSLFFSPPLPPTLSLFLSLFRPVAPIRCKQSSTNSTIPAHQSIVVKTTIARAAAALWKTYPTMVGNGRDFGDRGMHRMCLQVQRLAILSHLGSSVLIRGFRRLWCRASGRKRSVKSHSNRYRFIESRACR